MPLPANNNNKDTYPLLDLSSDASDDLHLELPPIKKKKLQRKNRSRGTVRPGEVPPSRPSPWQRSIRYTCWIVVLTWLVVLTFTATALNQRLGGLDNQLHIVSTSNDGVNDILQTCHTDTKNLQANASSLAEQLAKLTAQHEALQANYTNTASELGKLQAKIADMPDLINPPVRLGELVNMVADMGSRLSGIDVNIKTALETANAAKQGLEDLKQAVNVSNLAVNASTTERKELGENLKKLSQAIESLNKTISTRLNSTEQKLKEYAVQLSSDASLVEKLSAQIKTAPTTTAAPHVKATTDQVEQREANKAGPIPVSLSSASISTTQPSNPTIAGKLKSAV